MNFYLLTTSTCVTYTLCRFSTPRGETKRQVVKAAGRGGGGGEGNFASPHCHMPLGLQKCPAVLLSDQLAKGQFIGYNLLAISKRPFGTGCI